MFLFPIFFIFSLEIYSKTVKVSLFFKNITIQCVPVFLLWSKLITYARFFNLGRLCLKKHH